MRFDMAGLSLLFLLNLHTITASDPFLCSDTGLSTAQVSLCSDTNIFNLNNRKFAGTVSGEDMTKARENSHILSVHDGSTLHFNFQVDGGFDLFDIVVTQSDFERSMSPGPLNVDRDLGTADDRGVNTRLYVPRRPKETDNLYSYLDEYNKGRQIGTRPGMYNAFPPQGLHFSPHYPLMRRYPLNLHSLRDRVRYAPDELPFNNMLDSNPSMSYLEACIAYPQMNSPLEREIANSWRKFKNPNPQASTNSDCGRDNPEEFCFSYIDQFPSLSRNENTQQLSFATVPDEYQYCAQFLPSDGCENKNTHWYQNCRATCFCYDQAKKSSGSTHFFSVFSRPESSEVVPDETNHHFSESLKFPHELILRLQQFVENQVPKQGRGRIHALRTMSAVMPADISAGAPCCGTSGAFQPLLANEFHIEKFMNRVTSAPGKLLHTQTNSILKPQNYLHGLSAYPNTVDMSTTLTNPSLYHTPFLFRVETWKDHYSQLRTGMVDLGDQGCDAANDQKDPFLNAYLNSDERKQCSTQNDCSNGQLCIETAVTDTQDIIARCYSCPAILTSEHPLVRMSTGEHCYSPPRAMESYFHFCPSSVFCPTGTVCAVKKYCTSDINEILDHAVCLPENFHPEFVAIETVLSPISTPYPRTIDHKECTCSAGEDGTGCSEQLEQLCIGQNGSTYDRNSFSIGTSFQSLTGEPCSLRYDLCVDDNSMCVPKAPEVCNHWGDHSCHTWAATPPNNNNRYNVDIPKCLNIPKVTYPDISEAGDAILCAPWTAVLTRDDFLYNGDTHLSVPDCEFITSQQECNSESSCQWSSDKCNYNFFLYDELAERNVHIPSMKDSFYNSMKRNSNYCRPTDSMSILLSALSRDFFRDDHQYGCFVRMNTWPVYTCPEVYTYVQTNLYRDAYDHGESAIRAEWPTFIKVDHSDIKTENDRRVPGFYRFLPCSPHSDFSRVASSVDHPYVEPGRANIKFIRENMDFVDSLELFPFQPLSLVTSVNINLQCLYANQEITRIEYPKLVKFTNNVVNYDDTSRKFETKTLYDTCTSTSECIPLSRKNHIHMRCLFDPYATIMHNVGNKQYMYVDENLENTVTNPFSKHTGSNRIGRCIEKSFATYNDGNFYPLNDMSKAGELCIYHHQCKSNTCVFTDISKQERRCAHTEITAQDMTIYDWNPHIDSKQMRLVPNYQNLLVSFPTQSVARPKLCTVTNEYKDAFAAATGYKMPGTTFCYNTFAIEWDLTNSPYRDMFYPAITIITDPSYSSGIATNFIDGTEYGYRTPYQVVNSGKLFFSNFLMPLGSDLSSDLEFVDKSTYLFRNPHWGPESYLGKNLARINVNLGYFKRLVGLYSEEPYFSDEHLRCLPDTIPNATQLPNCLSLSDTSREREKELYTDLQNAIGVHVGFSCTEPQGTCVDCPDGLQGDLWGSKCYETTPAPSVLDDCVPKVSARLSDESGPREFFLFDATCPACTSTRYCSGFNKFSIESSEARQFACMDLTLSNEYQNISAPTHTCQQVPRYSFVSGNEDWDYVFQSFGWTPCRNFTIAQCEYMDYGPGQFCETTPDGCVYLYRDSFYNFGDFNPNVEWDIPDIRRDNKIRDLMFRKYYLQTDSQSHVFTYDPTTDCPELASVNNQCLPIQNDEDFGVVLAGKNFQFPDALFTGALDDVAQNTFKGDYLQGQFNETADEIVCLLNKLKNNVSYCDNNSTKRDLVLQKFMALYNMGKTNALWDDEYRNYEYQETDLLNNDNFVYPIFYLKNQKYTDLFFGTTIEGRDCRKEACYQEDYIAKKIMTRTNLDMNKVPKRCVHCPRISDLSGDDFRSGKGCGVRDGGFCMSTEMCDADRECVFGQNRLTGRCLRVSPDRLQRTSHLELPYSDDIKNNSKFVERFVERFKPFNWSHVDYCADANAANDLNNAYPPTPEPTEYPTSGDSRGFIIDTDPPTPEPTTFSEFYKAQSEETRQSLEIIFIMAVIALLVGACMITVLVQLTKRRTKLTLSEKNNLLAEKELQEDLERRREAKKRKASKPTSDAIRQQTQWQNTQHRRFLGAQNKLNM